MNKLLNSIRLLTSSIKILGTYCCSLSALQLSCLASFPIASKPTPTPMSLPIMWLDACDPPWPPAVCHDNRTVTNVRQDIGFLHLLSLSLRNPPTQTGQTLQRRRETEMSCLSARPSVCLLSQCGEPAVIKEKGKVSAERGGCWQIWEDRTMVGGIWMLFVHRWSVCN